MKETKLPDIKCSYCRLNKNGTTKEEYGHCGIVWNKFKIKKLRRIYKIM